ncbi:MAG: hypothetical protein JW808_11625 [Victivallales bacterium]|nr:hypothetical protein [Victivallales bacterium]
MFTRQKMLALMAMATLTISGLWAQDTAQTLKEELKAAQKEFHGIKSKTLKEFSKDGKVQEIQGKKRELDKELEEYLIEKKPEIGDALKKVNEIQEKINALKKPAKKGGAQKGK